MKRNEMPAAREMRAGHHETEQPVSTSAHKHGRTVAVVLCAGQGTRLGAAQNKVFLPLAGKPLVLHALDTFAQASEVDELLLVAHPREVAYCEREIVRRYDVMNVRAVIGGGASRHQSEERALEALRSDIIDGTVDVVLIHDGARPFLEREAIDRLVRVARGTGGALLATAVADDEVIARATVDGSIHDIYAPGELWRAQTPQAFDARTLLMAYDQAHRDGFEGTDTAASYERLGHPVHVVSGSLTNFKVTTPDDLLRAEWLAGRR